MNQHTGYLTSTMQQNIYRCLRSAAFTQPKEQQAWFKPARSTLKRGQSADLLNQMQTLSKQRRGDCQAILCFEIQHFTLIPPTEAVELFSSGIF